MSEADGYFLSHRFQPLSGPTVLGWYKKCMTITVGSRAEKRLAVIGRIHRGGGQMTVSRAGQDLTSEIL
jgi:hypothetical protein